MASFSFALRAFHNEGLTIITQENGFQPILLHLMGPPQPSLYIHSSLNHGYAVSKHHFLHTTKQDGVIEYTIFTETKKI
jgi:hypothetical protein